MSNPFLVLSSDKFLTIEDGDFERRQLPPGVITKFFGGGKTSTSTSQVTIPPEVLARYNAVNAQAQQVAQTPFQQYSNNPNAFVAPLTPTQQAGIINTNAMAGEAQPFYGAAAGLAGSAAPTNVPLLGGAQIGRYMNPFVQSVVNPTAQLLNQQQQAQMSGQTGQAIQQGAFGGDRAGLAAANLAGQQSLAFANAINPLYSQAYNQALQTAAGQQAFNLQQQQANNQLALQQAGLFGQLGAGAQAAGLQGAQAQLAAGQQQQQTQQAGLSALYNQFLQQQAYPFQTAQFLANIAEGTGALSGSTTTATQPAPFFSDERLKDDVEDIGRTHDGQKIVQFRYKGEKGPKRIGLLAQDVEKTHPEAVGLAGGYKTVDYDKALEDAASMGGAVMPEHAGLGFARGGYAYGGDPTDLGAMEAQLLAAHQQMYGPGLGGLYGGQMGGSPGKPSYVPQANLPVGHLAVAALPSGPAQTGLGQGLAAAKQIEDLYKTGKDVYKTGSDIKQGLTGLGSAAPAFSDNSASKADGGLIGHYHRDSGGPVDDNPSSEEGLYKSSGPGLNIPEINPNAKLATAPAPGGGGGDGGLGSVLKAGTDILGLFLSHGGLVAREHHADVGSVGNLDTSGLDPDLPAPDVVADSAPIDYGAMTQDAAKRHGLNPAHPLAIFNAESGLRPVLGDDGSSGGVPQLHVGGISKKYPNPGLGDDFIRDVHPELADKSPQEKLAFINAPENQPETIEYSAAHMAKHGFGSWSTAKGLGLAGNEAFPTRIAQTDTGTMTDAGPQGGLSPAGGPLDQAGNWFEQHQNAIIPILAGLGAMASSPSRYLGSAILTGLGGGAQAYANLQKQQAEYGLPGQVSIPQQRVNIEAQRNALETAKYLTTSMVRKVDPVTNEVFWVGPNGRISDAEHSALLGQASQVLGNASPTVSRVLTGQQPAGGPGKIATPSATDVISPAKTTEKPSAVVSPSFDMATGLAKAVVSAGTTTLPKPAATQPPIKTAEPSTAPAFDETQISSENDRPTFLKQKVARLTNAIDEGQRQGIDPQTINNYVTQRQQAQERADGIINGTIIPFDKNGNSITYYKDAANQRAQDAQLSSAIGKNKAEYYDEARSYLSGYQQNRQLIDAMATVYRSINMNRATEGMADAVGYLRSIPAFAPLIPDSWATMQGGYDEATKNGVMQAFQQLASSEGQKAPKSILAEALQTVATPSKAPEARMALLAQKVAQMDRQRDMYSDWLDKNKPDPANFALSWDRDETHKMDNYIKKAQKEIGVFKGAAPLPGNPPLPSGPTIPQRPSNVPVGSQFSPKLQKWRTPDGIMYDASGQKVQ